MQNLGYGRQRQHADAAEIGQAAALFSQTARKAVARRTPGQRRARRTSAALALSRLEREHVALLLAICELEPLDAQADENSQALRHVLLPLLREDLRQTQHALERAAMGGYGFCEECHKPLATRQLEIAPATTRCPICAARDRRSGRDLGVAASRTVKTDLRG